MATESAAQEPEGGESSRRERQEYTYTFTGFADLLPDWVLPADGKQHVRNARKELLLAFRSMVDACIERQERGVTVRRTARRVEIE